MASKVYADMMNHRNITVAFRKCGIYPFDSTHGDIIPGAAIAPSLSFAENQSLDLARPVNENLQEVQNCSDPVPTPSTSWEQNSPQISRQSGKNKCW